MLTAFCKAMESHKAGDNADLDVAVFGANGYNFVGFLMMRYGCAIPSFQNVRMPISRENLWPLAISSSTATAVWTLL